jgi:hypothetical protein
MTTSAPIGFIMNVEAMRSSFELLGSTTHVVSAKGMKWVSLLGDVGILSLHAAEWREERGVFFDTDEPRARTCGNGHSTQGFVDECLVDKAFRRTLTVTDPG